ncbi:MAG: site-specific integrase [Propionibacteriales bacterium]|nr:site-specific integrase [Propionibacteriales bacterium]
MQDDRKAPPRRVKVEKRRGIYYREDAAGKRRYEITFLDSSGRRRWQTVDGRLREAEAALEDVRVRKRRGERIAPTRVTLAEYADTWLEAQRGRLRPKTVTTYDGHLRRHVVPRLGRHRLAEINEDDVAALISEMRAGIYYEERCGHTVKLTRKKPFASWTIRGTLSPLSAMLGHAARRGMISANPVARLERGERPTVAEKEKRILTSDEIRKLLKTASPKYRTLIATGIYTGLRLGELLGLTWADVDFDAGFIHVRKQLDPQGNRVEPKTPCSVRDVVLIPQLARLLKEHKEEAFGRGRAKATDPVFASEVGSPMERRNVAERGLGEGVKRAGLNDPGQPKLTMHSLRDTFASHLILDLGLDVVQVSRQLGHSKPSVTANTYARLFDKARHADAIREAMAASDFGNALEKSGGDGRLPDAKVAQLHVIGD